MFYIGLMLTGIGGALVGHGLINGDVTVGIIGLFVNNTGVILLNRPGKIDVLHY